MIIFHIVTFVLRDKLCTIFNSAVGERTHLTDMLITLCRELVLTGKPFFAEEHSVQKKCCIYLFLGSACGKMYNRRTNLSEESTWELFFISTKKPY